MVPSRAVRPSEFLRQPGAGRLLTSREREVLRLLALSMTNPAMAERQSKPDGARAGLARSR
jgi:DNA-binding CsgD family transcriptional regulator